MNLNTNFLCLILLTSTILYADNVNKQAPLQIHSESAVFDGKKSQDIFKGHVILTQGTTQVTGDQLQAFHNAQHHITKVQVIGDLARYQSIAEGEIVPTIATAKIIWYYPDQDKIQLIGEARVQQGPKEMSGPKLEYYPKKQLVIATGDSEHLNTMILPP